MFNRLLLHENCPGKMGCVNPVAVLLTCILARTPEGLDQDLEIAIPVPGNMN